MFDELLNTWMKYTRAEGSSKLQPTLTERRIFISLRPTFLQVLLSSSKDIYIYLPRGRGFTEKEARKAPIHNS